MIGRQRGTLLLLVLLAGGVLASWLLLSGASVVEARQLPGRRPQVFIPTTAEPPLAPGSASDAGTPPGPAAPPATGTPPGRATPPGLPAPPPTATEPVDPPAPHVTIRVRVPALATPGQELEYRLVVENTSQAAAHHVRVRCQVPTNSRFVKATPEPKASEPELIWQLETLAASTRKEIVLIVVPDGVGDPQCCARVQFEHGQCVRTRLTQPELQVHLNGPTHAVVNDNVSFQIEVTNSGQREAAGVVLANTLPPGLEFLNSKPATPGNNPLTWDLGNLAAGKSVKVEYQALVAKAGTLINKAEVKDSAGLKQETSFQVVAQEPKLALAVTGPQRRIVGRPATYLLTVSNPGSGPAINVEVFEEVSPALEADPAAVILSASAGGKVKGGSVRWSLGVLPPGARQTVQLVVQARKPGKFINGADATADRGLKAHAEAAPTLFEASTSLAMEIDKSHDPLEVGKTGSYTLRVVNQGTAPATQVKVVLTLPDELKVTDVKGKSNPQQEGQKITFAPLEALAPGAEAAWTVTAEALRSGEVRLRASVDADQLNKVPLNCEESTMLYSDGTIPLPPKPAG